MSSVLEVFSVVVPSVACRFALLVLGVGRSSRLCQWYRSTSSSMIGAVGLCTSCQGA